MRAKRKTEQLIEAIDRDLAAAELYLSRGINSESNDWLHLSDWRGKSGHPLWMKNVMVPGLEKSRAKAERRFETYERKCADIRLGSRRTMDAGEGQQASAWIEEGDDERAWV
jgi:hypothetical protein